MSALKWPELPPDELAALAELGELLELGVVVQCDERELARTHAPDPGSARYVVGDLSVLLGRVGVP